LNRPGPVSNIRTYARNAGTNWIGYGANLVVMFFLSPFVVHSLGSTTYGVWSLIVSLTGYLGLVELGVRGGVGRFINYYLGKEDIGKVNGIVNTALAFFLSSGIVLFAVAGGVSLSLGMLFRRIPIDLVGSARAAILLVAFNLWLSFFSASFIQILTAFERFDLSNAIAVVVLAFRTAGTILVLKAGGGIVELAGVQVISSASAVLAGYLLAQRVFPKLRIALGLISKTHLHELLGFSIWGFISNIAWQLIYYTDTILIALLLGPEQVTLYAIPAALLIYGRTMIDRVSVVVTPQTIKNCARYDLASTRTMFRRGTVLALAVAIPLLVGMIFFGEQFLGLWMGEEYRAGATVLAILAAGQLPNIAISMSGSIFAGLNRVRLGAGLAIAQGVANLGLSLVLVIVLKMGIEGVAWGTFVPGVLCSVVAGGFALRWIDLPVRSFLAEPIGRCAIVALGFAALCALANLVSTSQDWASFWIKVCTLGLGYLILAWFVLISQTARSSIRSTLALRPALGNDRSLEGSRR